MNDLWKYSAGQWTWVGGSAVAKQHGDYGTIGVAGANNIPGARNAATLSKDSSGNVWLFGGLGYDESTSTAGILGDLWEFSGGQWTWMSGPKVQGQKGIYGTQGVASASNVPGARVYANSWVDSAGDLWLFGGDGYDVNGTNGALNDLWKYSSGQWTWMEGSNVVNRTGVYGTQGTAAANNTPGARQMGVAWTDASGNAWLFGGNGYGATSSVGELNDLWKYSSGQWMWVSGSSSVNQSSTYGTEGTLAPGNIPDGRIAASGWVDAHGNLWLIGGWQLSGGVTGNLNDLWMYMP